MPITSSLGVMYEFGAAAIFGAASKTYIDWKNHNATQKDAAYKTQRQKALVVLGAFIVNSIFAVTLGSHAADLFVTTLPEWSNFGKAVAYLTGAVAINIMSGLVALNWRDIFTKLLRG